MLQSIRGRLLVAYFLLILLALAGAGAAFFYISERWGYLQAQEALRSKAVDVQKFINHFGEKGDVRKALALYVATTTVSDGIHFVVVDADGRALFDPSSEARADPAWIAIVTSARSGGELFWDSVRHNYVVLHLSTPLHYQGRSAGFADYSRSLEDLSDVTHRLQMAFAQLGGILTAFAMLLSYLLTRRILQPVVEVREVAAQMAAGNLGVRVPVSGEDEFAALGATINSLADEIQRNIDSVTAEKNKLDAILSSMVDGVITLRPDGIVTFANSLAGRVLADYVQYRRNQGQAVEDPIAPRPAPSGDRASGEGSGEVASRPGLSRLVGSNLFPVIQTSTEGTAVLPIPELIQTCLSSGDAVSRELTLGERDFNVFAIPLRGGEEEVLLLLRDVTSLRQVEIARSQFLGNVSHELKTPLTIIKGFVITLQKSPGITDEWQRYLDYIDRETDRLARLVDDLLNLARLRSKRTQMNFTFCEPLELLKETYRQLLPQAAKYDVTLAFDYPASLPVLLADSDRVKEVIINLVDNAFKYSPPKTRVVLTAEATEEHLVVAVHDSGPGIPEEEVPFLFERFFRGTDKGGRKSGGSGIGLAIVKEVIDAHRGSIRVESKVGVGTRFVIQLPLRQGEEGVLTRETGEVSDVPVSF